MNPATHTVERAVIMAAGEARRMHPLSLDTPKPLIRVNGKRMIDTVVDALLQNGIREIYVVTGYLKEQFEQWAAGKDYIFLIENPYYKSCNNISSLYVAREHLNNCIILDGDQVIHNPDILSTAFTLSGYHCVRCENGTTEWLMQVKDGIVTSCSRNGGKKGWQLYSISRWSEKDGRLLCRHVEEEFEKGNHALYWDDVVMFSHFKEYTLGIREMQASDVTEIDTLQELVAMDPSYDSYLSGYDVTP